MVQATRPVRPDIDGLRQAIARHWPEQTISALDALLPETGFCLDTRRLLPGGVFIAIEGAHADGRDFIEQALMKDAAVVLAQGPCAVKDARVLVLPGLDDRLGELIAALYPQAAAGRHIAVTGTNGKSSVTHYVAALLEQLGESTAVIGTLGMGTPGQLVSTGLTTPDPLTIAQTVATWHAAGIDTVALEASSHALDQQRLSSIPLHVGIFTNLTRDHLDYHGTMLAYAAAKARLFQRPELRLAVINTHDDYARLMTAGCSASTRTLSVDAQGGQADFSVIEWTPHQEGQRASIDTPEGRKTLVLGLLGRFNLDNVLLALGTLYGEGYALEALLKAAEKLAPVPGRMQLAQRADAPVVVVDYAHTPDALENALKALHDHVPGKLWCIVGCGGDRDAGKRPLMAAVAEAHADHVVITDDNPRTEAPEAIRAQMMAGLNHPERAWAIGGRRDAIAAVVNAAEPKDVILIAGKGHEDYQEVMGVRHPFDDMQVAMALLDARGRHAD